MSQVLWKTAQVSDAQTKEMAAAADVPVRVARWLCSRGIAPEEARSWLKPDESVYHVPQDFVDMRLAVQRMLQAVHDKEKIAVVGDYDVDGVTASTILASTLSLLGADVLCDIPHRVDDGYGLSEEIVRRLSEQGVQLLATVDNGIRSTDAIALAVQHGIDVIVTDHHEPGPELPKGALAIVHWSRSREGVDLSHLSGAGVAWKLCQAVLSDSIVDGIITRASLHEHERWMTGLAALGALADIMPMVAENRKLIQTGIECLAQSTRAGWRALSQVARVDLSALNDRSLLWRITPRLNAAGRMDSAHIAFDLLMTQDPVQAEKLARQLEALNTSRRAETDKAVTEANAQCERIAAEYPGGFVVWGPWSQGIVGIVAARLVDLHQRPVIVLADDAGDLLKGSGRSPQGMSLYHIMERCEPVLHHFGGHDAAVGCGVSRSRLSSFRTAFARACQEVSGVGVQSTPKSPSVMTADDFLPLSEANLEMAAWVAEFAPYGPGNPPFTFYLGPMAVESIDWVGKGRHAKMDVSEGSTKAQLIWFNAPETLRSWQGHRVIGAIVELDISVWRNVRRVQLRVVEARTLTRVMTRTHFSAVYRLLKARRKVLVDDVEALLPETNADEVSMMMEAFVELGFAERRESAYHVVEPVRHRDLRESRHYHNHLYGVSLGAQG